MKPNIVDTERLWAAEYTNVKRLARYLRITPPSGKCVYCRAETITKIVRRMSRMK